MSKVSSYILIVILLLIGFSPIIGETVTASRDTSDWGEASGGLRLRAIFESSAARGGSMAVNPELIAVNHPLLETRCLTTKIDGSRMVLRVFDEVVGKPSHFWLHSEHRKLPDIDIAIDNITDIVQFGSLLFGPFLPDWPASDQARGQLELFIPPNEDEYWSGVLSSAPFQFKIIEANYDMEEITFVIPTKLVLAEGPSITFDSASIDTVTILGRRGYYRAASTRCSGMLIAGHLTGGSGEADSVALPFLPHLRMGRPLPGSRLFVNGETTIEIKVDIYEAKNKPWFYHGLNFDGPYKTIWQKTFKLGISRDELLALTPGDEDEHDYSTCLVPYRVRLEGDKLLSFGKMDVLPYEFQLMKGNSIGYSILVNNRNVGCYKGYPQSPLTRLRKHPSCDSPVEIMFRIFEYKYGKFRDKDNRACGSSQTLWLSKCTIDKDSGTFALEASDDYGPRVWGWRRWRQCCIPGSLNMTEDGRIVFDSTDMLTVSFKPWSNNIPLIRITVDEGPPELLSTQLCNPLARWHPSVPKDSTVEVTIDIVAHGPPSIPDVISARAFWSKSYRLSSSNCTIRPNQGGAK